MGEYEMAALPIEQDYRRCERIWRRVSPGLAPYPDAGAEPERRVPSGARGAEDGAEAVRGFLRDELADAQVYRCLARQAPTGEGRRLMLRLAGEEAGHARALQAAYFLLTGGTYAVAVVLPPQPKRRWCDALRERYHEETGGTLAYARAAEGTEDPCRARLYERLSADECRHAEQLRALLERTL